MRKIEYDIVNYLVRHDAIDDSIHLITRCPDSVESIMYALYVMPGYFYVGE